MSNRYHLRNIGILAVLLLLVSATACTSAAPEPAEIIHEITRIVEVKETVLVTQIVEVERVVTATPVPPTNTPEPTTTEAAAVDQPVVLEGSAELPEGFEAWSLPRGMVEADGLKQSGAMTEGARPAEIVDGKPALVIEVASCTFVYTFDEPVAAGTKLVIYDSLGQRFVEMELTPTEENLNKAYAVVTHPSLVEAQVWSIVFRIAVEGPDGSEIRSEEVIFQRGWRPQPCYGGTWPNPVTGRCPEMGEAHPWDPWYQYSEYGGYNEGVTTPGPIMPPPWE